MSWCAITNLGTSPRTRLRLDFKHSCSVVKALFTPHGVRDHFTTETQRTRRTHRGKKNLFPCQTFNGAHDYWMHSGVGRSTNTHENHELLFVLVRGSFPSQPYLTLANACFAKRRCSLSVGSVRLAKAFKSASVPDLATVSNAATSFS